MWVFSIFCVLSFFYLSITCTTLSVIIWASFMKLRALLCLYLFWNCCVWSKVLLCTKFFMCVLIMRNYFESFFVVCNGPKRLFCNKYQSVYLSITDLLNREKHPGLAAKPGAYLKNLYVLRDSLSYQSSKHPSFQSTC